MERTCGAFVPHMWGQSLYILACLLQEVRVGQRHFRKSDSMTTCDNLNKRLLIQNGELTLFDHQETTHTHEELRQSTMRRVSMIMLCHYTKFCAPTVFPGFLPCTLRNKCFLGFLSPLIGDCELIPEAGGLHVNIRNMVVQTGRTRI